MALVLQRAAVAASYVFYRGIARPIAFCFDSERVHDAATRFGAWLGEQPLGRRCLEAGFAVRDARLEQSIAGLVLPTPVGLAAGFDYEAQLPNVLAGLGFGFGTVGTVTRSPYEGNAAPRLGRLVQSQSLLVNKGLKSSGAANVIAQLRHAQPSVPIGLSIGPTNSSSITTPAAAIEDIVATFCLAEEDPPCAYYELNISCPNLQHDVDFYTPSSLAQLLAATDALHLKRPLFVKMPIHLTNDETMALLQTIAQSHAVGVILGNLQKDRSHPTLVPSEVAKYPKGFFSGRPTRVRSTELIAMTYRTFGERLVIIGCGGVFSADDAWEKIASGASALQLITGMVFEGPQLPASISLGLLKRMKAKGFGHIREVVGHAVR